MKPETLVKIQEGKLGKGDVLGIARVAGIGGAKQTSNLIPLCHPVSISAVSISFEIVAELCEVAIFADVSAIDRTGPDMEAMSAAATAALTIYDMCKAIDREMTIVEVCLLHKSGGKSGVWERSEARAQES
jgi:cyclic pyranopterin phosphate synthase